MIALEIAFLVALLVFSWMAHYGFPVVMRSIVDGAPDARTREFRRTAAWQWALAIAGVAIWMAGGRTWEGLGFRMPQGAGFWASLVIAGGAAALLQAQLMSVRRSAAARREVRTQLGGSLVFMPRRPEEGSSFTLVSVTAGICEEVLYRGWLFGWLAPKIGMPAAFAVASVAFALTHSYAGRSVAVRAGLLGVGLGALYLLSGSLWIPIALHAFLDVNAGQLSLAAHSDAPVPQPEVVT